VERKEIRKAWDEVSETYADTRDPTGSDADLIDTLLESLPPEPDVLDVGCGDGARTLANLPDDAVGIDISRRGLELATGEVEASLLQADMASLPFVSDAFDGITAYHAVFHVPREKHPDVYEGFRRALRPGGTVLMTLPGGRFETVRRGWMGGKMYFSAPGSDRTVSQMREAGFVDIRTETVTDPLGSTAEFVFGKASG
jgi:SAM-dependent methyltransferase